MKVLLVDDSKTMRNIWKKVVTDLGDVDIHEAGDGEEAFGIISGSSEPFALVLLDWNMPKMDGFTLLKKIRETNKTTPVIMVTTEAEKPRIIEAIKAGANNYVVKPFTPDKLMEKINETLSKVGQTA